jgi:hypothetical protein
MADNNSNNIYEMKQNQNIMPNIDTNINNVYYKKNY